MRSHTLGSSTSGPEGVSILPGVGSVQDTLAWCPCIAKRSLNSMEGFERII